MVSGEDGEKFSRLRMSYAKALHWEKAWHIQGAERRPRRLEWIKERRGYIRPGKDLAFILNALKAIGEL